jgi:protein-tyrosine phosphatase
MRIGVMFVCFGNICRSPSAEGVFRAMVEKAGLSQQISTDSTGTAAINIGNAPDPRAILACKKVGIDISHLVARQICDSDYDNNQYIIAMDRQNLMNVNAWKTAEFAGEIALLMEYHPNNNGNYQLPDPYNSDQDQFYRVIESIELSCAQLLTEIKAEHQL